MAQFEINIYEIEETGKQYDFSIPMTWLDPALRDVTGGDDDPDRLRADATVPGLLSVWAEKTGADVVVHGTLRMGAIACCARCLGDAPFEVDVDISTLFTRRGENFRPPADEDELDPDELDRDFFTGDIIDLDAVVLEHVLLEAPIQSLCDEDCPGIEVPAHVKGPEDLRLSPLLGVLEKLRGGSSAGSTDPATKSTDKSSKKKGSH